MLDPKDNGNGDDFTEELDEQATELEADGEEIIEEISEEVTVEMATAADEENPFAAAEAQAEAEMVANDSEDISMEGTELEGFESAAIEELEFIEGERLDSIIESILFASDRPVSLASIKVIFKGTQIKTDHIRKSLNRLAVDLASANRGVTLEEVPGGYQLRTKLDNMKFITRAMKARPFKLSGPALEVLAIVAYKQPVVKAELDEIRGVESGHLLRALMEKGLVNFEGKSDLPGKPMQYGTTKKFLEIFGLRNLKELPTLSQIDEILPEGIGEEYQEEKQTLDQLTGQLSREAGGVYSEGEEELNKISEQLAEINTSSEFFEAEKVKARQQREADKADRIREALENGVAVSNRDRNWLIRYDEALRTNTLDQFSAENEITEEAATTTVAFEEEEDTSIDQDLALETELEPEDEGPGPALA